MSKDKCRVDRQRASAKRSSLGHTRIHGYVPGAGLRPGNEPPISLIRSFSGGPRVSSCFHTQLRSAMTAMQSRFLSGERLLFVLGQCRFGRFPHFKCRTVSAAQVMNLSIGPLNGRLRIAALSFDGKAHSLLSVVAEAAPFPPTASTATRWLHGQCRRNSALGRHVRGAAQITRIANLRHRVATRYFMLYFLGLRERYLPYANCEPAVPRFRTYRRQTMSQFGQERPNRHVPDSGRSLAPPISRRAGTTTGSQLVRWICG
jgi:hypothetical protein